jgi:hypothetical protein
MANDSAPLRILAGDDADPDRSTLDDTVWSVHDGRLRSRNRTRGPPTYLLDGVPSSAADLTDLSRAADGARTTLHRPVVLPVADDWRPVAGAPVDDVRVLAETESNHAGPADANRTLDDRRVTVRHDQYGHWLPVRNATVSYEDESYTIENPAEATVNVGRYVTYTSRLRAGQRALLRTADDPSQVSVATTNGTAIAEGTAGGTVPTQWADPNGAAIRHHWADVMRASPGAFDGDRLLVGESPVRLFVPGDFTGHVPSSWSTSESCGPDGRSTRRWERWSILDVNQSASMDGRQLSPVAPGIYRIRPPATNTASIEHTASIDVRHEWGVDDDCGEDRANANTVGIHHTVETSLPLEHVRSENLSVAAFVLERPDRPIEVHYHVANDRGLTRGGLGSVTFSVDGANHTWHTPWTFYPLRTYDGVALKGRNGTTMASIETGFHDDARFPTVYRDRVEAEGYVVTANDVGFVATVEAHGPGTSNRAFQQTVQTSPVAEPIYTHYGGTAPRIDEGALADAKLTARNVLGESIETRLRHRRYRPTSFAHRIGDRAVAFRLTSNGTALSDRTVVLRGARRREAVTNETGWVRVHPVETVVGVTFAGSGYRTDRSAYYERVQATVAVPGRLQRSVWTVSTAVFTAVTAATSIGGWLAIGWYLRWQRRRRPRR